ncbi:MAG: hypothetical protein KDI13_05825 [Alphaproteobacteria bacterium]|nr:hypothetical protein [Alphaproteobacteria bacterium]
MSDAAPAKDVFGVINGNLELARTLFSSPMLLCAFGGFLSGAGAAFGDQHSGGDLRIAGEYILGAADAFQDGRNDAGLNSLQRAVRKLRVMSDIDQEALTGFINCANETFSVSGSSPELPAP